MTPLDRAALAAALKDATPETLREDAAFCARMAVDRDSDTFRRLAALALAVAEWNERPARLAPYDNSWDDEDDDGNVTPLPWALRVPMTMTYTHHATLVAALAALIRTEGA